MATYVDGFVIPISKKKLPAYRRMATLGAKMWKRHGALEYFECVGDDLYPTWTGMPHGVRFPKIARAKKGEVIIFSFIVFKSRAHRDLVNKKVMNDPAMGGSGTSMSDMPFDIKRMAYGGFKTIVQK